MARSKFDAVLRSNTGNVRPIVGVSISLSRLLLVVNLKRSWSIRPCRHDVTMSSDRTTTCLASKDVVPTVPLSSVDSINFGMDVPSLTEYAKQFARSKCKEGRPRTFPITFQEGTWAGSYLWQ